MNIAELNKILIQDGFPSDTYSLDGSSPFDGSEAYILSFVHGTWIIEYIERGKRREIFRNASEEIACREFLAIMNKDVKPYLSRILR